MTAVQAYNDTYSADRPHRRAQELALSPPPAAAEPAEGISLFGPDGFTFGDLVDMVNPLQHIPIVSTFYREETGDRIAAAPRVIGSTLFFGPLGLAGALANLAVEGTTGKDIGEHVAAWVGLSDEARDPAPQEPLVAAPGFDPDDPVSQWARGEADWARKGPPASDTPHAARPPLPDAGPLLAAQENWASGDGRGPDIAVLNGDALAASRAYESVAGRSSAEYASQRPGGVARTL